MKCKCPSTILSIFSREILLLFVTADDLKRDLGQITLKIVKGVTPSGTRRASCPYVP